MDKIAPNPIKSVLVVDDDVIFLRSLRDKLGGHYRVFLVRSSIDALKFLEKQIPDVILLDYAMPVCTVSMFLTVLESQEQYSAIPIVFLTGPNDSSLVLDCVKNGASGCLMKSASTGELLRCLRSLLC